MSPSALPGEDLVDRGVHDLALGIESIESLLVSCAGHRLRMSGVPVPATFADAELRLYRLLSAEHGDGAHGRYNALVRRLVSFQRAIACAR